ncbi:MAG: hypothetical protein AAB365_00495 [Patescibacteria group bacterium]
MSDVTFDALTKHDTDPFEPSNGNETAVRLFTEHKGWYIGLCNRIGHEEDCFLLGMDPFIRFGHNDHLDPQDPGDTLFRQNDRLIKNSIRTGELPFRLKNAQRVIHGENLQNILVIRFDGGAAVVSRRRKDIGEVHEAIRFLESFGA